jgi:hypothetical protein
MAAEMAFARAVWLGLGILALMLVWRTIFVPAIIDHFRQDLFALRRELFLMMADGKIEPTHPAYVRLRSTMNGLLRFAERVSLVRVTLTMMSLRPLPRRKTQDLIETCEDDEVRAKLEEINSNVGVCFAALSVFASPVGWLLLVVLVVGSAVFATCRRITPAMFRAKLGRRAEPIAEVVSTDESLAPDEGLPAAA